MSEMLSAFASCVLPREYAPEEILRGKGAACVDLLRTSATHLAVCTTRPLARVATSVTMQTSSSPREGEPREPRSAQRIGGSR
jgi:hypothetical protein